MPMGMRVLCLAAAIAATAVGGFGGPAAADDRDDCYKKSGDVAIAACTRRIAVLSRGGADARGNLAVVYNSRAAEYFGKGQYQRALDDLNRSVAADPAYSVGRVSRGMTYYKLNQFDLALSDLNKALDLGVTGNSLAKANYYRGLIKRSQGDRAGGNADVARGKALNPDFGD